MAIFVISSFFNILYSFVPVPSQGRAWEQSEPTDAKEACHSELVEESALEVTAPASAIEFPTRWNERQVPRELRPQVQILRLRGCAAPLRMTLFLRFAKSEPDLSCVYSTLYYTTRRMGV
jgi:hypothetical protein